jgi:hypothetical protein
MFQIKVVEKIKPYTYFILNNFISKNLAVYDIIWKYAAKPDRPQMII